MRTAGGDLRFERAKVVTWFDEGNDALRIVAITIMQAREDCRYFPVVLKAVKRPHSLMEQYQALKLGEEMIDGLDRFERRLFRDAIVRANRKRRFKNDAPLMRLSDRILGKMIERRPSETQVP